MRKSLKLLGKPCCRGVLVGVHLGVVELSRKAARRNVDLFPVASQKIDLLSMEEIKIGQETNYNFFARMFIGLSDFATRQKPTIQRE